MIGVSVTGTVKVVVERETAETAIGKVAAVTAADGVGGHAQGPGQGKGVVTAQGHVTATTGHVQGQGQGPAIAGKRNNMELIDSFI